MLDGREAVIFLVKVRNRFALSALVANSMRKYQVKEYIEDPRRMLLG